MIVIPETSGRVASIVAIDPGTINCGAAVLKFDLVTMEIVSTDAFTLIGEKLHKDNIWMAEAHGERLSRVHFIINRLVELFEKERPFDVVSESPFFSRRRPQAFASLTEFVTSLRWALMRYDAWMTLTTIDPPSVKIAVGAEVQGGKESVRQAILKMLPTLNYTGAVPFLNLGPDAVDALAIAVWRWMVARQLVTGIPVPMAVRGKKRAKAIKRIRK